MPSTAYVRVPVFLWVCGTVLTICLGAVGFVASQQVRHEGVPGHAETRERLGRMEQQTKDGERRLEKIESNQEAIRGEMNTGFHDLLQAIQGQQ